MAILNSNQPLVSIYLDSQNVHLNERGISLLQNFAKSIGNLFRTKLYYNSLTNKKCLGCPDVTYKDVPCPLKNSLDNRIISDLIKDINQHQSPSIVILVSGDGDFVHLIKTLKQLGKRVIVFGKMGHVKAELIDSADEFHYVDNLQKLMVELAESLTNSTTTVVQSESIASVLNYQEANKYLLEAIQIASSQNKSPCLSNIDNLMRKHFPCYQGARCICNDNGKNFSRFSKFIEAVVNDGKIMVKDNKLFLV